MILSTVITVAILPVCGTNASDQLFKGAVWDHAPYHDRAVNLWTVQLELKGKFLFPGRH